MRRLIHIWSFLILVSVSFGQESFYKEMGSEMSYFTPQTILHNSHYYVIGNRSDQNTNTNPIIDYSAILFKLDSSGEVIDSLSWFDNSRNTIISEIIVLDNDNLALLGSVEKTDANGFYELFFYEIDEELQVLNEEYFDFNSGSIEYVSSFINKQNNICIASTIEGNPPNVGIQFWDKLILEISQQGELIFDSIYNHAAFEIIYDFIPYPNSNNYILYCRPNFQGGNESSEISIIDSNFNLIETYYSQEKGAVRSMKALHDTVFLVTSRYFDESSSTVPWYASVRKSNALFEDISYEYDNTSDSSSYPALYNSLSIVDDEKIYAAYTLNFDKEFNYSSLESYFCLYHLDEDLNIIWKKYYGGDAYYKLVDFQADQNGFLLTGTKYKNINSGPLKKSLVVFRLDENGLITSTNNNAEIPIKNAIVLPNPGKEYLELHTGMYPATLQLYNLSGSLVLEEAINSNVSRINTLELSPGTYIWSLVKEGKVVEMGKWIRE